MPGNDRDHSTVAMMAASFAYYFRPQAWLRKEIDARIRRSMPADLNPDRTMSVPLRRSDKCHRHNITGSALGELDCPTLQIYIEDVRKFLEFDPLIENIIVTSEEKSACDEFLELVKEEFPSLRVVLNAGDLQQVRAYCMQSFSGIRAPNVKIVYTRALGRAPNWNCTWRVLRMLMLLPVP